MFLVIQVVPWTFDILIHKNIIEHSVGSQNISGGAWGRDEAKNPETAFLFTADFWYGITMSGILMVKKPSVSWPENLIHVWDTFQTTDFWNTILYIEDWPFLYSLYQGY